MTGASAEETVSFCGRGIREPSGATTGALVALLEGDNVGWRPGTPDNLPILGPSGVDGLVLATGHYRNGVLLTPVTADATAELIGVFGDA